MISSRSSTSFQLCMILERYLQSSKTCDGTKYATVSGSSFNAIAPGRLNLLCLRCGQLSASGLDLTTRGQILQMMYAACYGLPGCAAPNKSKNITTSKFLPDSHITQIIPYLWSSSGLTPMDNRAPTARYFRWAVST